jgi:hypothetical protein
MRAQSCDGHSSDTWSMVTPVVARLLLGPVDNMTTHRINEHHGAAGVRLHHRVTNVLGTDECPGQVDVNETSEHLKVVTSRKVGASEEQKLDEEL